jgi:hypothetical protein
VPVQIRTKHFPNMNRKYANEIKLVRTLHDLHENARHPQINAAFCITGSSCRDFCAANGGICRTGFRRRRVRKTCRAVRCNKRTHARAHTPLRHTFRNNYRQDLLHFCHYNSISSTWQLLSRACFGTCVPSSDPVKVVPSLN